MEIDSLHICMKLSLERNNVMGSAQSFECETYVVIIKNFVKLNKINF